ncbi:MAG: peptidoglycan bridge formation glycyltransferase FemA/FemB family protein [Chloroflexota bacterium]|nr:peptidoglycan bridge formation glycyltransferase FemA/FemB family protein [Chloroflexota bacterium]
MNVEEAAPATPEEQADWARRTVQAPGGHVYQSLAWAEHRRASGWRPRFLRFDDGFAVLALERSWPFIGGASAYLPRGPIAAGEAAETTADRLAAVTDHLAGRGVDVLATDAELPADTGYGDRIRRAGFRPIPEIQPSRHRISLPLPPDATDDDVRAGFGKSTRQRINGAERAGLRVARYDAAGWTDDEGLFVLPARPVGEALHGFYSMLESTGGRRGFHFGPRSAFVPWWQLAHDRGLLVYLEVNDDAGASIGGLALYRHGGRLTTVHSADRTGARTDHPGLMHLLRWRAIQLAMRERCNEMDLGGVDIGPYHREPVDGEPMFGLYEHKRSFGAEWVEMTGAHERVIRPWRYLAGRAAARAVRLVRR